MPDDSALVRKVRGPLAEWDLHAHLLRLIEFDLRGANWQRSGGKTGNRPKPLDLPDRKGRGTSPAHGKPSGADVAQRLRNLGLMPAGS